MRIMIDVPDGAASHKTAGPLIVDAFMAYMNAQDNPMTCATCRWHYSDPSEGVSLCSAGFGDVVKPEHFCAAWEARK